MFLRVCVQLGKNRSKFSNFLCSWANFHCLKWPNIEQMLLPSGHTVSNSKQRTYKSLKALKLENLLQPFQRVLSFKMELRPSKSSKKNLRLSLKIMEHTYFLSVPRYLPIVSIYLLSLCTQVLTYCKYLPTFYVHRYLSIASIYLLSLRTQVLTYCKYPPTFSVPGYLPIASIHLLSQCLGTYLLQVSTYFLCTQVLTYCEYLPTFFVPRYLLTASICLLSMYLGTYLLQVSSYFQCTQVLTYCKYLPTFYVPRYLPTASIYLLSMYLGTYLL